ncbi:substrate-binding domain-containing protein [Frigoribacterium sp. 2-23]|uniref:substrate-binding domain-containing protein n=1 Tax=Frigoribacterium sp. 2-23 TaxID=3415006 RepID=UPI003C6FCE67
MTTTRHRTRRRALGVATALTALVALALTGCSIPTAGGDKGEERIGALYLDSQGFYGGVKKGVQDGADSASKKVSFLESTSAGDVSKESSFMNTLTSSGVSAIIMSAVSNDGSVPAVKQASEAGMPVICYNTCVNDDAVDKYVTAWVLGDPLKFGGDLGKQAAEYFTSAGITAPKMGVINCEQYEVCQQRFKGFKEALTSALPGTTFVANQEGAEVDKAVSTAEQMLSANPDLDGLYGEAGGATVGAYKAVHTRGLVGKVAVFGSDMTSDIATELADGSVLKAVVDISGIEAGKLAFAAAQDAIDGKTPKDKIVAAPIDLYLQADAAGWTTAHADGLP